MESRTSEVFFIEEGILIGRLAVLALMVLAVGPAAGRAPAATGGDEVILKSRRFVPAAGLSESLRARVRAEPTENALHVTQTGSEWMHVIIQLTDIPSTKQRAELADAGVQLLSYIPSRAWLAAVRTDRLAEVPSLPGVRAVTDILPQDKLAPSIAGQGINAFSRTADGRAKLVMLLFEDVDIAAGQTLIASLGGACVSLDRDHNCLVFNLPVGAIDALAADDRVKWLDQHYESADLNDGVRAAAHVDAVQAVPYGVTGSGVVLGQWESKHPDSTHVDLAGRVVNVDDNWPVGDHATQVAGTMIGDGRLLPNRQYRGVATEANLVSYRTWENVTELRNQYREAITLYDIDIANNSWGKVEWNLYKEYAGALDDIVRGGLGKRISMVWAVGNEGSWGTILCTAAAKNIVSVGATNSDDDALWPWSNKGPTEDGRLKPDIVAPGCEARNGGTIWSALPDDRYGGACGTSSAAPGVSGIMAMIIQDWRATHGTDPWPSTIKGLVLHTARDLGEFGPDFAYGYGLIDARAAIDLVRADALDGLVVEGTIEQHAERDAYTVDVAPETRALKVTLVWDDYPGDPLAAPALVNDLDLIVTGPTETRHYPWTLARDVPEQPAVRTSADHTNNVEQVSVANPAAGQWQIGVWGTAVPRPQQTYSLVIDPVGPAEVLSGRTVLSVAGTLGQTVARFDDEGNLVLRGVLTTGIEAVPPGGAFVINSSDERVVGYIDLSGNMCIEGQLYELSQCELAGGGLVVKDWSGNTVASVDAAGNLCLSGRLYQDTQP